MRFKSGIMGVVFALVIMAGVVFAQQQQSPYSQSQFQENTGQVYIPFTGQWLPDVDSELIGFQNFKTLTNMRYKEGVVEGTNGYSKINTSIIDVNYYKVRSGFHFKKDYPTESHVLVQAYNYDGTISKIYDNETAIPDQGDFNSTPIHTDASYGTFTGTYGQNLKFADISSATHNTKFKNISTATHNTKFEDISVSEILTFETFRARFSRAPRGNIAYSNGVESQIWGGNESQIGAFILSSSDVTEYITNPQDHTQRVDNEYDTSTERVTIDASGDTAYCLVGALRPISGISFYMQSANATAGAFVKVSEWNGSTWAELAETDGTNGLSQNGEVSFASTVDTSKVKYLEGRMLNWYLVQLSAGSAVVYNVTLDIPWQNLVDRWDNVYRQPVKVQVSRGGVYTDETADINESAVQSYQVAVAEVGGLTINDHIIIGFEDRLQAIYFDVLTGNTNTFGPNTIISYWNGSAWVESGVTYDHTGDGDTGHSGVTPLGKSGALTWQPPDYENEFQQYLFGAEGYFYKIQWGDTLGGTGASDDAVTIDRIYGVPAPLKLNNFKFPVYYQDRVLLFGYLKGNQANRVDFCLSGSADVWNGVETSNNGSQSLWIGGSEEPTAAVSLYNRYGSNIYESLVIFKKSELYILSGDGPGEGTNRFKVNTVSTNIGCPAPYTVSSAEVGYEMVPGELQRNIIIWLSSTGPYLFDGAVIVPIMGIDKYFDKADDDYVGASNIKNAFAWFDPTYREWNLIVGDYWFAYDFIKKRWFQRDTGTAEDIQSAFQVADIYGNKYIYGAIDTGYVMRLENGNNWDGVGITQTVETGDFYVDGNPWHQGVLKRLKLVSKTISEAATVQITYYADIGSSGTSIFSVALNSGLNITRRATEPLGLTSAWMHRLKYSVTTDSTNKGWQPLGHGYQYGITREDLN